MVAFHASYGHGLGWLRLWTRSHTTQRTGTRARRVTQSPRARHNRNRTDTTAHASDLLICFAFGLTLSSLKVIHMRHVSVFTRDSRSAALRSTASRVPAPAPYSIPIYLYYTVRGTTIGIVVLVFMI